MRYTEYHCGVAVIKDKDLLKDAMAKLAKYEDMEEESKTENISRNDMVKRLYSYCNHRKCAECVFGCSYCSFSLMSDVDLKRRTKYFWRI